MSDLYSYLFEHFDRVLPRLVEHLWISFVSMLIAMLISLPLGLLLSRKAAFSTPALAILGAIYTIPSFAFLAFLVPITGIGATPAIIALAAYALAMLTRNTMVAFNGVDPMVKEAARGMGMSGSRMLWRVEVPLALPIIVAGMRIATLSTLALTTIAAWIGAGGLGQLLREGITNPPKLYAGVIAVAAIAVGADLIFRLIERIVEVPRAGKARRITLPILQPQDV